MMDIETKKLLEQNLSDALENKRFSDVIHICEKLRELDPKDYRAYWDASYAYRRLGDLEKANMIVDKSIETIGLHPHSLLIKGDNYFDFGFYEKAEEVWESLYQSFPNHEITYHRWFITLIKLRDYDKAIKVCKLFFQNNEISFDAKEKFISDYFFKKMWFELSLIAKALKEVDIYSLSNVFSDSEHLLDEHSLSFYDGITKEFFLRNYGIEYDTVFFQYVKQEIINSIRYYRKHAYLNLLKSSLDVAFCHIFLYESSIKREIAETYVLTLFFQLRFNEAIKFIENFFQNQTEFLKLVKRLFNSCVVNGLTEVANKYFKFSRLVDNGEHFISIIRLNKDGKISGSVHPNESYWESKDGIIVFRDDLNNPTSIFLQLKDENDIFLGLYFKGNIIHKLEAINV